jgi:hypothetical protein
MSVKAKDVALELRKLADALDKEPETEIQQAFVFFTHYSEKSEFLSLAKMLPRPLKKSESTYLSDPEFQLEYQVPAIHIMATIKKSVMCSLVKPAMPAVYRCDPLLSLEEEESLGVSQ